MSLMFALYNVEITDISFFFSSRRRHTRWPRDWSSDVCSSDLQNPSYSVTGWRVGWVLAPPGPTQPIRKVHDFLTVGAAAPLQQAGASALHFPQSYYDKLAATYAAKRERLLKILTRAGFTVFKPRGAYYIMTDISRFNLA